MHYRDNVTSIHAYDDVNNVNSSSHGKYNRKCFKKRNQNCQTYHSCEFITENSRFIYNYGSINHKQIRYQLLKVQKFKQSICIQINKTLERLHVHFKLRLAIRQITLGQNNNCCWQRHIAAALSQWQNSRRFCMKEISVCARKKNGQAGSWLIFSQFSNLSGNNA